MQYLAGVPQTGGRIGRYRFSERNGAFDPGRGPLVHHHRHQQTPDLLHYSVTIGSPGAAASTSAHAGRRLCHVSATTNVALVALGACALPRYGRYKSPLWRHTHDMLDAQNDAFGDLTDIPNAAGVRMAVRDCVDGASGERELW
jgi:hypothetical protein